MRLNKHLVALLPTRVAFLVHGTSSERSFHNAPTFRLLVKVTVNVKHQYAFLSVRWSSGSQPNIEKLMILKTAVLFLNRFAWAVRNGQSPDVLKNRRSQLTGPYLVPCCLP